jgi:hypothetical protein
VTLWGFRIRNFVILSFLVKKIPRDLSAVGMLFLTVFAAPPRLLPQATNGGASPAVITFTLDFPKSNPEHYSISIDANGHANYESTGKVAEDSDEETYRTEFDMSAENRQRVFDYAKQAHYFEGKIDSGNGNLAFTGTKLLSYQDGQRSYTARYNYPKVEPVRQLTALFQNMAATLEFGRRLAYYHRYQKLALDEELKRMVVEAKSNGLIEIGSVAPILREIVGDSSVINVVRARAQELLQMGNGIATAH